MKLKTSIIKILFLFLTVSFFMSCEQSDTNEEIQNVEENEWNIQTIDRGDVEDPGDRGDKD